MLDALAELRGCQAHRAKLAVALDFGRWKPVSPPDSVFVLATPPGFAVKGLADLAGTLSPPP